jgi:hypothetical protein
LRGAASAGGRASLADAERLLQEIASEPALLQMVILLPNSREALIGFSNVEQPNGGARSQQILLSWDETTSVSRDK